MNNQRLAGKVVIVTGAASRGKGLGIGKAISILFARAGAKVLLVNRTESRAYALQREIEEEGGTCSVCLADVTDAKQLNLWWTPRWNAMESWTYWSTTWEGAVLRGRVE